MTTPDPTAPPDTDADPGVDGPVAGLLAEQRRRWRRGDRTPVEDYLARAPAAAADPDAVLDLISNERMLRAEAGEAPGVDEYVARFPHLADALRVQFEVEAALRAGRFNLTTDGETGGAAAGGPAPAGPDRVGAYEILDELGRGGMGVVYRAWHPVARRVVALKMILAGGRAKAEHRDRFRTECEAVARLQHPNIVQLYDAGEHAGQPYVALEYVAGGTLQQRLDGVPWPARRAAELVEPLARAAHHAHGKGIVHRDLKPANVLLDLASGGREAPGSDGSEPPGGLRRPTSWVPRLAGCVPKLTDFGLAKLLVGGEGLTVTGDVLGTPSYMAPEQAAGRLAAVGPAADVYALGAILYELLTGRPPFQGATVLETMDQIRSLPPVPPRQLQPRVPRDLETVCLKCLQKEPPRRYAAAGELADDLGRFLRGEPVKARRAGRAERAWRWCRRNPTTAGLIASVATLLVVIAVGASVAAVRLTAALTDSEGQRHRAETAEAGRTDELFHSYVAQARAKRLSGTAGRRFDALTAVGKAAELARELGKPPEVFRELRSEAIAALALPDLRSERAGRMPPGDYPSGVWDIFSPDMTRCVAVADGAVVVSGADDRPQRRLTVPRPVVALSFGPDGRHVAAGLAGGQTAVWDLDDPRPGPKAVLRGTFSRTAFRRDGRQLALRAVGGGAVLYDVTTGQPAGRVGGSTPFRDVAPDPTGRRLAAVEQPAAGGGTVRVFDLATGAEEVAWPLPADVGAEAPAWNDDGTLLAAGVGRTVHVWAFGEGPPRAVAVLERHQNVAVLCRFIPGTGLLLSSGWDKVTRLWDAAGGRQLLTLPGYVMGVGPDGRVALADSTGGYAVWRLDPAAECRLLHHGRAGAPAEQNVWVVNPSFAPDGRLLATVSEDGARLWDAATGLAAGPPVPADHGSILFLPGSGDLITYAGGGPALRWPRTDRGGATVLGPPRWLADGPHVPEAVPVATPEGTWLAYVADDRAVDAHAADRAVVVHTADPTRRFVLGPQPRLRFLSLSPDGRQLASGTWHGWHVLVRDVETGREVHRVDGETLRGWLSPDGRRLATLGEEVALRLWDAGSWAAASDPFRCNGVAGGFAPDGRRLAVSTAPGVVRLIDAADGRPLADLELPASVGVMNLAFSPAGDRLAVATQDQFAAVWDLAAVRRTLARMGLDWEETPPPPPTPLAPPPRVEVVGGDLAADPAALRRAELDRLGLALWANPFDAAAYFERGRLLAADRQDAAAYAHFTAALALRPDRPAVRQARLTAAVRLGRWADALADAAALAGHWPDDSAVEYPRAIALHGLGRDAEAAAAFTRLLKQFPDDSNLPRRRADCYDALDRPADALADRERAVALAPNDSLSVNNLAWTLATGPPGRRDPKRAVELARRAVRLRPDAAISLNTLGVALYRDGQYAAAVPVLEKSLAASGGASDAWDLFFLAMCRHRLGRPDEAKADLARAVAWVEKQTGLGDGPRAELKAFRAEAEALLKE